VEHGLFQIIAVGTPPDEDGSADLRYVLAVARTIGTHMSRYCESSRICGSATASSIAVSATRWRTV
jgi:UDP-glucose 6-dehydrogenase